MPDPRPDEREGSAGPDLRIDLLGGFRCTARGAPVGGPWYDTMRALLAFLAVERDRDHPREALAALLWSGTDRTTARGNLRRTLSDLRRALDAPDGRSPFVASRGTLRLAQGIETDVDALREPHPGSARDTVAGAPRDDRVFDLYRGEFMAGFALPGCAEFEEWLVLQRETHHRRALALLERAANEHERDGDPERALACVQRHAELEPWDEAMLRRAMRLHAASGRHGAALRQFEAASRRLRDELGVAPGEQTRRLAERIRATAEPDPSAPDPAAPLRAEPPRPVPALPVSGPCAPGTPPAAPRPPPTRPERRRVTVLYVALELPTAEDDVDPDDAMERIAAPRARSIETIARFGGHLVPMPGGGLLAYFGYPRPLEDASVRAVRAARAIVGQPADGLEVRAGVHTGPILTGTDPALPDTVGRTSGIAIRLRRRVDRGEVAIGEATHALVAGWFDCTDLGERPLPDSMRPMRAYRVDRDRGARTRLDASTRLTPLVGRGAELERLVAAWRAAKTGPVAPVLVQGAPGIGKSRLVQAFGLRLRDEPHAVRWLRCQPEDDQSPLRPLLSLVEAASGFAPEDDPPLRASKLAAYLETHFPALAADAVPVIAALCQLPVPAHHREVALAPPALKALAIDLLGTMLPGPAPTLPLLLVVEDLHWADPSTLDGLAALFERPRAVPILGVLTARPEFAPAFAADPMPLDPLDADETARLIASVAEGLPRDTVRRIAERADGIPLFAEELAKSATRSDPADIPATLHELLAARVDRLGDSKPVAQLAASIGREFDTDLLRRVAGDAPRAAANALDRLKATGLVVEIDPATCQFSHALVREAVYASQTRSDRRAAHLRIARALQRETAGELGARPELLARHLTDAGEAREAVDHWLRAGQRAVRGSANLEAIGHFRRGLQALSTLPESEDRDRAELGLLAVLCPALHATQGYGAAEAGRVTARMAALHERVGGGRADVQAEWARLRNTMAGVGPRDVPKAAMRLLEQAGDDPIGRQAAHYVAAVASFWLGEFEDSRRHAEAALSLHRPAQHAAMLEAFGEDLSVSYAGHLSWALCFLGDVDGAQRTGARMLERARAMGHPKTLAMALLFASMLARWLNDVPRLLEVSAETLAVTRDHGMSHWIETAEALHGWAETMLRGRRDLSGLESLSERLGAAAPAYSALRMVGLGEMNARMARWDAALGWLERARILEARTGTRQFTAERLRLEGECLLAASPPDAATAEARFREAIEVARGQRARLLVLRASTSLARLRLRQGRGADARRLLSAALAGVSADADTPDLTEAASLLGAGLGEAPHAGA